MMSCIITVYAISNRPQTDTGENLGPCITRPRGKQGSGLMVSGNPRNCTASRTRKSISAVLPVAPSTYSLVVLA